MQNSNELLLSALVSALGLGATGLAAIRGKSVPSRRRQGGSKRSTSSGPGGMNPVNRSDLRVKPPTLFDVPKSVPRNIAAMVTWDIVKVNSTISNGSSGLVETNFAFTVNQNPQYASWLGLFDQYAIPLVSIEFDSLTPPGQTYSPPVLYTALDFDNTSNISTIAAIEEYDTCEYLTLAPEKRHLRSVRPCTKLAAASGGGGTPGVSGPIWCDSGVNNVYHYGIRSIAQFSNAGSINVTTTLRMCYRNHI
jgi:hypothetical protein